MTFRMYLVLMGFSTILAWVAWGIVLWNVNPYESGLLGLSFFYITLTVGLVGSLTLLELLYRVGVMKRVEVLSREVKTSFRHALLLTAVSVVSLILSSQGVFHWWVLLVLIVTVSILEYLFLLVQHAHRG